MIPPAFDYRLMTSVDEATEALSESGEGAVLLAGGQSLLTALKLRRRRPATLLDLRGIAALRDVTVSALGEATIGAMARQATVSGLLGSDWPLLAQVAQVAADPMVRRCGTLVGAFCEADPGGDWLAAGLALDATIEIHAQGIRRTLPLNAFVRGAHQVDLRPGEVVTATHLPRPASGARMAYRKVKHPAVGWSVASVAAVIPSPDTPSIGARVAVSGATAFPQRLPSFERALGELDWRDTEGLARAAHEALEPISFRGDTFASADYRAERLAVLLKRTIAELRS